jgi:outer membrane protein
MRLHTRGDRPRMPGARRPNRRARWKDGMRREAIRVTLVLAFVGGLAAAVDAQEPEPLRLSLDAALEYASGSNPALRQATNTAQINGVETRTTWLDQLLPSARLTLFETAFTGNLRRRALDNFGNPIANPQADWNYFSQTTHSLRLNWSIQGPSLFQTHRAQMLANQDRDLARDVALTDVQFQVQRLYADALEQRELLRAEEELVEARRIDQQVAERLFGLALRSRVDVLGAELEVEQQALAVQRQDAAYQRALLALKTAMGLSDDRPLELVNGELPLFDPDALTADALISRAREVNPELLRSDVAIRSAEVAVAQRRSVWWPQVDLGFNVYRQAYEPYGDALFDARITRDPESNFFVSFSLPILNGYFQEDLARQQASVELSNRREADREATLRLEESIRGSLLDLESEWRALQLSERSSVIAAEALALAREEYRLGTRSFEDLRSAIQQEADTRRQVITARYAFVDALLALEEAVGAPVRDAVSAGSGRSGSAWGGWGSGGQLDEER